MKMISRRQVETSGSSSAHEARAKNEQDRGFPYFLSIKRGSHTGLGSAQANGKMREMCRFVNIEALLRKMSPSAPTDAHPYPERLGKAAAVL